MRWNDRMPPMVMKAVNISTRKRWRRAAWTILWIIQLLPWLRPASSSLALQRVGKLQEQTAIPDYLIAGLEAAGDLRLSFQAFAESNRAPAELVRRDLGINKGHVFAVAQNRRIRKRDGILDRPRSHRSGDIHVLLEFSAGITGLDAGLQGACVGIEGSGYIRDASLKNIGIRVGLDGDRIAVAHVRQILLIDIDQHPHVAGVGDHEALSITGLNELPHGDILLNHFAADGRKYGHFERRRAFQQRIG